MTYYRALVTFSCLFFPSVWTGWTTPSTTFFLPSTGVVWIFATSKLPRNTITVSVHGASRCVCVCVSWWHIQNDLPDSEIYVEQIKCCVCVCICRPVEPLFAIFSRKKYPDYYLFDSIEVCLLLICWFLRKLPNWRRTVDRSMAIFNRHQSVIIE